MIWSSCVRALVCRLTVREIRLWNTSWLGYDMFDAMTAAIQEDTVRLLFNVRIEQKVEREQVAKVTGTNKDDSAPKGPVRRES